MANDFSGSSDWKAVYEFEDGASFLADSQNDNDLTDSTTVVADTSVYIQGTSSADFERGDSDYLYITDTNLSTGFPLKSGDSVKQIVCSGYLMLESISGNRVFVQKGTTGNSDASIQFGVYNGGYVGFRTGLTSGTSWSSIIQFGTAVTTAKWYHVVITYDDSDTSYRISVYDIDADDYLGTDVTGTVGVNINVGSADLHISGSDNLYDGRIDELAFGAYIPSTGDIDNLHQGLYAAGSSASSSPSSSLSNSPSTSLSNSASASGSSSLSNSPSTSISGSVSNSPSSSLSNSPSSSISGSVSNSPSSSLSNSPSSSPSPSSSISGSPSTSISSSLSNSPSTSISGSISSSPSPSSSISGSASSSPSSSLSDSGSVSISSSPSASASASTPTDRRYFKAAYATTGGGLDTNAKILDPGSNSWTQLSAAEYEDLDNADSVYVSQTAVNEFAGLLFQIENDVNTEAISINFNNYQTSIDPDVSAVTFYVWDQNSVVWEQVAQLTTGDADTDYSQNVVIISSISNYWLSDPGEGNYIITFLIETEAQ